MFKYNLRAEAARNIGSKIYMKPEEIEELKRSNNIVASAVHPDTNEVIPFYMR